MSYVNPFQEPCLNCGRKLNGGCFWLAGSRRDAGPLSRGPLCRACWDTAKNANAESATPARALRKEGSSGQSPILLAEARFLRRVPADMREEWRSLFQDPRSRKIAAFVATATREDLLKLLQAIEHEMAARGITKEPPTPIR